MTEPTTAHPVPAGPAHHDTVIAYRVPDEPGVLLCREHGHGHPELTPLTSEDLDAGGICTYSDPAKGGDVCGRDVLIDPPAAPDSPSAAGIAAASGWTDAFAAGVAKAQERAAAAPAGLRDRIAAALYEHSNEGSRWADAHPHDVILFGGDADAVLAVLPTPAAEVEKLRARVAELSAEGNTLRDRLNEATTKWASLEQQLLEADGKYVAAAHRVAELEQQAATARADAYRQAADDISPSDDCDCDGCAICADLASAALLRDLANLASAALLRDLADRMTAGQAADRTADQP